MKYTIGVTVAIAATVCYSSAAMAHHTTITCTDQETATWSIVNSENRDMTFTTSAGQSGNIGPRGTAEVQYPGSSLTVYSEWSNGVTRTNTGDGECTPTPTTTSSTVVTTSSTIPPSTTTSVPPATSTTTDPAPTTTVPLPSTSTSTPPPNSPPSSTAPPVTAPPTTWDIGTPVTLPPPTDPPATNPVTELPTTGSTMNMAFLATIILALGGLASLVSHRS